MPPTIMVVGAAGATGRFLSPLLLQHTDASLVLAGRDGSALERAAAALALPERVSTRAFDARNASALAPALAGIDLVVVVAPVSDVLGQLVRAAASAGSDLIDINYSAEKLAALRALHAELLGAGRTVITEGGFHPGVPAILARAVEEHFDTIESALIGSVIQIDWRSAHVRPDTMREFVEMLGETDVAQVVDGRWVHDSWISSRAMARFDFGAPFGKRSCYAMGLEELRLWGEGRPGLRRAGFYVGGFNPVVDYGIFPIMFLGHKLAPKRSLGPVARLLLWGLTAFTKPPYGTLLRLEAEGVREGKSQRVVLTISHEDGYGLTAIPVAATVMQWLDHALVTGPGVHLQALAVEPERFLADAQRLGARVTWEATPGAVPATAR